MAPGLAATSECLLPAGNGKARGTASGAWHNAKPCLNHHHQKEEGGRTFGSRPCWSNGNERPRVIAEGAIRMFIPVKSLVLYIMLL